MTGAHLVDDAAALVLDLPALLQLAGLEAPGNLQIQLRHGGVGPADAEEPQGHRRKELLHARPGHPDVEG